MTRMAHHQMPFSASREGCFQLLAVRLPFLEGGSAGEAVVDSEAKRTRSSTETRRQTIDDNRLANGQAAAANGRNAVGGISHQGASGGEALLQCLEHAIAHPR